MKIKETMAKDQQPVDFSKLQKHLSTGNKTWLLKRCLGKGSFGVVQEGVNIRTGEKVKF
jgi:hypothetical protein